MNECVAAKMRQSVQGGGDSTGAALSAQRTIATVLTIPPSCSVPTPSPDRIGPTACSLNASATPAGGSGATIVYIDMTATLTTSESVVGSPFITCTGCVAAASMPEAPSGGIPAATRTVTNGAWDLTGAPGAAALSVGPELTAGSKIATTQTGPSPAISSTGADGGGRASGGSGAGGGSGPDGASGSAFNPMHPAHFHRDHRTLVSGYTQRPDGWPYTGPRGTGKGSGPAGFTQESVFPALRAQTTGANSFCLFCFPTLNNSVYGSASCGCRPDSSPAPLRVSATCQTAATNGTHYVGLAAWFHPGADFIGWRRQGAARRFAVIQAGGVGVATPDTGIAHGGKPEMATGAVPGEFRGSSSVFGGEANGPAAGTFLPVEYSIFPQGLPG